MDGARPVLGLAGFRRKALLQVSRQVAKSRVAIGQDTSIGERLTCLNNPRHQSQQSHKSRRGPPNRSLSENHPRMIRPIRCQTRLVTLNLIGRNP
jgi:hypothetical protein